MRRLAQLRWIPRYLDEIESDMSVFHRVDDIWSMPARKFFPLARRLHSYQGAMRERVLAEQREREGGPPAGPPDGSGTGRAAAGAAAGPRDEGGTPGRPGVPHQRHEHLLVRHRQRLSLTRR